MKNVKEIVQRLQSVRKEIIDLETQYNRASNEDQMDHISNKIQRLEDHDFYIWELIEEGDLQEEVEKEMGNIVGW